MLIAPMGFVSASGDDDDRDDDDRNSHGWHYESHTYEVKVMSDGVRLEIESENQSVESKIEMEFDYDDSTFDLEFEEKKGSSEFKQKMELQFVNLVEYEDQNSDGIFDENETILRSFRFSEEAEPLGSDQGIVDWQEAVVSDVIEQGVEGELVNMTAKLGASKEAFIFTFRTLHDLVNSSDGVVMPSQVKIDFIIDSWQWTSNTSSIALIIEIETEKEQDQAENEVLSNWALATTELTLGFSWADKVSLDGINSTVGTLVSGNGYQSKVIFSYGQANRIIHDPIMGALYYPRTSEVVDPLVPNPTTEELDGTSLSLPIFGGILLAFLVVLGQISNQRARIAARKKLDEDFIIPWLLPPPPVVLEGSEDELR